MMMSRFHNILVVIIFLLTIISLNITIKCVPDTTIQDAQCTIERWGDDDPYESLVRDSLSDLSINTVSQPRYEYYVEYEDEGETDAAYGFAICNLELVALDCMNCLGTAAQYLLENCPLSIGARVQMTDCFMRYEDFQFYREN